MVKATSLDALRAAAKAEVAAAMAKPLVAPAVDEAAIRQSVLDDFQNELKGLARKVARRCSEETSIGVGDFMHELLRSYRDKLVDVGNTSRMPSNADNSGALLLPQGTRFYTVGEKRSRFDEALNGMIIIEQEPQIRTILVSDDPYDDHEDHMTYHLPMPYVVFAIQFTESYRTVGCTELDIAFRKDALKDLSGEGWYHPPLPNFADFGVCMDKNDSCEDIVELSSLIINRFWNSFFEPDFKAFRIKKSSGRHQSLKTFEDWEKLRDDPLSILTGEWHGGEFPLARVLQQFTTSGANVVVTRAWNGLQPLARPDHIEEEIEKAVLEVFSSFTKSKS